MAVTEDAASVLEQFVHDVANLPGEIAHLYEEAGAKQEAINALNSLIATKDGQLQKFVKNSGSLTKHPKEDIWNKEILDAYTKAQALQDEKIAFVQKACSLLDRYVKRLDVKIRDLQAEGSMPLDNRMPSLLRQSEGNLVAIDSNTTASTVSTPNPLQPLAHNPNPSTYPLAQSTLNRLAAANAASANSAGRSSAPAPQMHPLHHAQSAATPTPAGNSAQTARTRESSVGSDAKKRRLHLGSLPTPSITASTRHASLGPGTPKAHTPGVSRAGSVGPHGIRPGLKKAHTMKKPTLAQTLAHKKKMTKKTKRRLLGASGRNGSPATTTGDELSNDASSGSEDGEFGEGGRGREEMDEASDDTKYCYCHDVSHGDMIACDNADCAIQWFHWTCAGITAEPQGEWLCRECRKLPREKIKKS
ncbi:hypothetical protein BT63DRAFT_387608 [Microthyrium microscopicum]|uniref:Chromatin modification-related protein n=1 Tax=Microthyrium microscopicum TaxID=703497 RepID=A0A6A6UC97_9PEZI|nr:hypothetical protein BT63DRAFT_387608 [Microthyrium microscopicum]